jgi:hypothetical protein
MQNPTRNGGVYSVNEIFVKKLFSKTERQTYGGSWLPGLRVRENWFRIQELLSPAGIAIRGCAQVAFTPLACRFSYSRVCVVTFTKKEIVDAHKAVEFSITLSAESIDAVNGMVDKAEAATSTATIGNLCGWTPTVFQSIRGNKG